MLGDLNGRDVAIDELALGLLLLGRLMEYVLDLVVETLAGGEATRAFLNVLHFAEQALSAFLDFILHVTHFANRLLPLALSE